jgi:hypothetical protein
MMPSGLGTGGAVIILRAALTTRERGTVVRHRGKHSPATRILAGALVLGLTLAPLAPAFAHPSTMDHCLPASAAFNTGRAPAMPCHTGDMSACTHAALCAVAPTAVLPPAFAMRSVQTRRAASLPSVPTWPGRLGFKPPTPPPNR